MTTYAEFSSISNAGCCETGSVIDTGAKDSKEDVDIVNWFIGALLILLSLVGVSALGYLQKKAYQKYMISPNENMFYSHLLPIPLFFIFSKNLGDHIVLWNNSDPYNIFGFELPSLWILCILNVLTQYVCSIGIHNTTKRMGTLTCIFATTIRKFLTLVFSVMYFGNPFTNVHWAGTVLVFIGTCLYSKSQVSKPKTE